jgi:ubiquinone/menaquinone biosynthesis C-methylase UbiE
LASLSEYDRSLMKLTGERPMQGATPDSLLAFHDAGYREVVTRLGPGVVVDIGCGVGDETRRLTAPDRLVLGADYSAETMVAAGAEQAAQHGDEPGLRFLAADGSQLALRDGSVDYAVSSHIIEHFTNPALHVAELARILAPAGTAFVITPNAPADFENPFHVYLFSPEQLASMLQLFFEDVAVIGLEGDEKLHEDFAGRRASGERLLKLDVLKLRHRMPRRMYVWGYERVLPVVYSVLGSEKTGIGSGLTEANFFTTEMISESTPGLFAIASRPRARVAAS